MWYWYIYQFKVICYMHAVYCIAFYQSIDYVCGRCCVCRSTMQSHHRAYQMLCCLSTTFHIPRDILYITIHDACCLRHCNSVCCCSVVWQTMLCHICCRYVLLQYVMFCIACFTLLLGQLYMQDSWVMRRQAMSYHLMRFSVRYTSDHMQCI